MKGNVEIAKTIKRLSYLLKDVDDSIKMDLYWGLLQDCIGRNCANANYVGQLWTRFLTQKIEQIDKTKKELRLNK